MVLQDDKSESVPFKEQMGYFVKNRVRLFQAIIVSLCWFVNCLQSYGLNLALGNLEGDILINSAITNGTAFGACLISYPILLYAKRKPAQIIGFSLTLLASMAYVFAGNIILSVFCTQYKIQDQE